MTAHRGHYYKAYWAESDGTAKTVAESEQA